MNTSNRPSDNNLSVNATTSVNNSGNESEHESTHKSATQTPPGVLGVFQSVLAAMFGVQSEEKRKQDFESGSAGNYIFVGIVMVVIFVVTLIYIVDVILEQSTK
ncbi:DUF2970 domain-containing protein [Aliikangiella marina]|uniref:DUF2970 domain-containing protein n=1 Tax=Aliikangiella marina TaxID=1712262 RepID=A0A545TA41_9GAMM|nr:DUF2970 domain-containing protein [Aliikangiella marina]TQV74067.1 DUF2970 domain-containing protein [Aliikangiella marina]